MKPIQTLFIAAIAALAAPLHAATLSAGFDHNAAVVGGQVWSWGGNTGGKLGNGSTNNSVIPVRAGTLSGVTAVATGMSLSLAVSGGSVYTWGANNSGQLGNGGAAVDTCNYPFAGLPCAKTPQLVSGLTGVTAIGAGWGNGVALKSDGTVWSWGGADNNELGPRGGAANNLPAQVIIPGVPATNTITKIAVGYFHTVALKNDGTLVAWGMNTKGQLGNGNTTTTSSVVNVLNLTNVVDIASRGGFTLALKSDGTVWMWGSAIYGQKGDGTAPVDAISTPQQVPVPGGGTVAEISAGFGHALVRKADGTVWGWGLNTSGQLGIATSDLCGSGSTLACSRAVVSLASRDGATPIAAGAAHSLTVRPDTGAIVAFGDNDAGQLGNQSGNFGAPYTFSNNVYDPGFTLFPSGTFGSGGSIGTGSSSGDLNLGNLDNGVYFPAGVVGSPTASSPVTITNVSSSASFDVTSVSVSGNFSRTHNCGTLAANGGNCQIDIAFTASAAGEQQGTLTINTNIPDSLTINLTLTGYGLSNNPALASLSVTGGTLSPVFASGTTTYSTSVAYTVAATTVAATTAHPSAMVSVNGNAYQTGSSSRSVNLAFGSNPITVVGRAEDGVTTRTYNVAIVRRTAPVASLGPATLAFGNQTVGTTSGSLAATLTNNGGDTLTIGSITRTGTNAADFGHTHNCGASLAASASCQINVTFSPGAAGSRTATLNVSTNDPANPTKSVSLSGTGTVPGPFTLTVAKPGAGGGSVASSPAGINCGGDCSESYAGGTVVTLTAVQNVTSVFTGWTGCGSINANKQCVVTMNAPASVTATFARSGGSATDFNADGRPDLIWSNTNNGATYVWHMDGPVFLSDAFIAQIDPSWKVQGAADFNGDGKADLVWRNTASGASWVWYMNGAAFITDAFLFSLPPEWVIQGVADFNADNKPDFLMRNTDPASGVAFAWFFDNNVAIGDQFLFGIDPAWKVEQVGDMNADGQPDLLFRNMSSGLSFAWYTQYSGGNLSLAGSTPPIYSIDPAWEVVQLADWNRDGNPDLVFRNTGSGVVFVWYLTGTTLGGSDFIIQIDPSWEIVPRR